MQKVLVPIVAVLCLGFLGFVFYLFTQDGKKPQQAQVALQGGPPPNGTRERPQSGPKVGDIAPEIIGQDVDGKDFKLSDYRGKVVVLDFWGFW